MAVGANESSKQLLGSLWTGVINMQVIALNPTMAQMKEMGMNPQQEPEYKSVDDKGVEKIRLDFYLRRENHPNPGDKIRAKVSFWLENRERSNKEATKFQYINKFGQTTWPKKGEDVPNYDWFSTEGMRKAFVGEELLMPFIKSWANVDPKDACSLDTIQDIIKNGNLTELQSLLKAIYNNQVQVLLGVKDGKYQDVYNKYFDRPYRKGYEPWKKALAAEYGEFKSDWQNDLQLKPYSGSSSSPMDSPTTMASPNTGNSSYKF